MIALLDGGPWLILKDYRLPSTYLSTVSLLKIGFVTLVPLRDDSDKLCVLLHGFVGATCFSDMNIVHKTRTERF